MKKVKKRQRNIRRKPHLRRHVSRGISPGITEIASDELVAEFNARERAALPEGVVDEIVDLIKQERRIEEENPDAPYDRNHPVCRRLNDLLENHKISDWLIEDLVREAAPMN